MRHLGVLFFFFSASLSFAQKNILIYTHNGKGYVHENIPFSVEAIKKICAENKYTCTATDAPTIFTAENLKKVDCIIFANTNNESFDTEEQRQAFVQYIRGGGGFVGIHSSSGSERQSPWFAAMLGGRFLRHPKLQPFTIKVIDPSHPATSSVPKEWAWEDEFYYLNMLNPDIRVLLAGDLSTVVDEKKEEYPGKTFGDLFPLAWCHEFEGGRQFYTALGHKPEHYKDENYIRHLTGGIRWALREK